MDRYSLSHLADAVLLRDLAALAAQDRNTTASLLAHLAEVEARKLYLPAAYPSMYAYCVGELGLSEDSACKRIRAARAARDFPALLPAVADGRLSLEAVLLLAPRLTTENADEVLAAAANKSKAEIRALLAMRFVSRNDMTEGGGLLAAAESSPTSAPAGAPAQDADSSAPARIQTPDAPPDVAPEPPRRIPLNLWIGQDLHEKLEYAQQLLSHQVRPGDVPGVIERAVDLLIARLEKQKFAATDRPARRRASRSARHISAHVQRAMWARDGGQCTFVSEAGRRCEARDQVEFDHVVPVARGGEATVEGIRLRCRAHNQFTAEQTFGAGFMEQKRREAKLRAAERRAAAVKCERAREHAEGLRQGAGQPNGPAQSPGQPVIAAEPPVDEDNSEDRDVVPWLRALGFGADEVKRAAARCETMTDASLAQRVRAGAAFIGRLRFPSARRAANGPATAS